MKRIIVSGLIAVLFAMMISTSYARVVFKSDISVKEEYNDNIFLTENEKEDDFITTVSPKIALEYSPNKMLDLSLDYGFNFRIYGRNDDLNDTSLRETQSIRFDAAARPFSRIFLNVTDIYDRVSIDQRRRTALDNAFFNKTDRNIFTISPYAVLPVTSSASVTAGYEYINTWYDDSEASDSDSHSFFGSLDKKFNPKLTGFLKYRYTDYRADMSNLTAGVDDYDKHEGTAGAAYVVNPRIQLSGEIGQSYLNSGELDDSDSLIWNVMGAYNQETEGALSAAVSYGKSFYNSIINGASKQERADVNVEFGRIYKISLNPYYRVDKFVNIDRKDEVAGISSTISHNVSRKITVSVSGSFEYQEFLPESNEVEQYRVGTGLDYRIGKNMTVGAGYIFNKRESDRNSDDYDNNIAWIQGKAEF
jgi:hypothetical protein